MYYINSVSGESVWEAPECGYYDLNQEFQWEPTPTVEQQLASESQSLEANTSESPDASADQVTPSFEDVAQQLEAAPTSTSGAAAGELVRPSTALESEVLS